MNITVSNQQRNIKLIPAEWIKKDIEKIKRKEKLLKNGRKH